jgi:hypothetical protein
LVPTNVGWFWDLGQFQGIQTTGFYIIERIVNNRKQWNWLFWWNWNLSDFLCTCLYNLSSADLLGTFDAYILL